MKILVYSLKKILFQGQGSLLNCKTLMGEITVLENHLPLLAVLSSGAMKIVDKNEKQHFFDVKSGFLEVKSNREVRCLVEQ